MTNNFAAANQNTIRNFFCGDIENGVYKRSYVVSKRPNHRALLTSADGVKIVFGINRKYFGDCENLMIELSVVDKKICMNAVSVDGALKEIDDWHVFEYSNPRYTACIYLVNGHHSVVRRICDDLQNNAEFVPIPQMTGLFGTLSDKYWSHSVQALHIVNEARPCYYEVLGAARSKLYIDIDYIDIKKLREGINEIAQKIKTSFAAEFNETITDEQIVVLRSFPNKKSDDGETASLHIIVNSDKAFVDPCNIQSFLKTYDFFSKSMKLQCDENVYRIWQKFRMVNSTKTFTDNRVFRRINFSSNDDINEAVPFDPSETLIQCYGETYPNRVSVAMLDPKNQFSTVVPLSDEEFAKLSDRLMHKFQNSIAKNWSRGGNSILASYLRSLENSLRMYELFVALVNLIVEQKNMSHKRITCEPVRQKMFSNLVQTERPWINACRVKMNMPTVLEFISAMFVDGIRRDGDDIEIDFNVTYAGEFISTLNRKEELKVCDAYGFTIQQNVVKNAYILVLSIADECTAQVFIDGEHVMEGSDIVILNIYTDGNKYMSSTICRSKMANKKISPICKVAIKFKTANQTAVLEPAMANLRVE